MSAPSAVGDEVVVVYGIVGAELERSRFPDGVEVVTSGPIAAVVASGPASSGPAAQVRRHDEVLRSLVANEITVLPMRFGTAVAGRDALVEEVLDANRESFSAALAALKDFVQYTVRVGYVEDAVVAAVLREDSRVAALREAARRRPSGQGAQISLGQAVAEAIERRRPRDIERIQALLSPVADRISARPGRQTDRLADYACLVRRSDSAAFEAELERLAERHHDAVTMSLLGPLAPYDFVPES